MTASENGFAPETAAHTAAYFLLKAERPIPDLTLGHWLYLAERLHAKLRGHAIFDDTWLATGEGPICHHALRGLTGLSEHPVWARMFARGEDQSAICRDGVTLDSLDHLSRAIILTCEAILAQYGAMSDDELVAWMRQKLPENQIFAQDDRRISARALALSVGFDDPDAFVEMDAESRSIRQCFADMAPPCETRS